MPARIAPTGQGKPDRDIQFAMSLLFASRRVAKSRASQYVKWRDSNTTPAPWNTKKALSR